MKIDEPCIFYSTKDLVPGVLYGSFQTLTDNSCDCTAKFCVHDSHMHVVSSHMLFHGSSSCRIQKNNTGNYRVEVRR